MRKPQLDSASGLRPASAFVVIGAVLALVGLWVGRQALLGPGRAPLRERFESDPLPAYSIVDREARPMALFVQRLDLVLSPNAMWQAHTPDLMAEVLSEALGGEPGPRELLTAMLPDAVDGVVTARFTLDERAADAIDLWARTGHAPPGEERPIDGLWLDRVEGGGWTLQWAPVVLLSEEARSGQHERFSKNPLRWSRFLADGLARCILGENELAPGGDQDALERQRAEIWAALLPSTNVACVTDFEASRALAVLETLGEQHVAHHQMHVARTRSRKYPAGRMALLGTWSYMERGDAEREALVRMGFAPNMLATSEGRQRAVLLLTPDEQREFGQITWRLLAAPFAASGLERACDGLLSDDGEWGFLDRDPASYRFRRDHPARKTARSYYLESNAAADVPRVVTTFDVPLQRRVGTELELLMEQHRPAIAMAIVVDVATGDVLALDSRESYELGGFAPLFHQFTPGSTFKMIVMAAALEHGSVGPGSVFDVGQGEFRIGHRVIREAEGTETGRLSASECLAHSINAGMAQIGLRVPAAELRSRFASLHYGRSPGSGLGGERPGYVPALPWAESYSHASVSFGHELLVTLWQHAAGLAAVVRGGEWRPLRLVEAVLQNGRRWDLELAPPEPVFSREVCEQVRDMMRMGAEIGTGRDVASRARLPELDVGTKTGTAEKVATEVCLHVELADQVRHVEEGSSCSSACRRSLVGQRVHPRSCYTSSMAVFGRLHDSSRELMVLVVADEPRGQEKYGSRVAGPAAIAILREALGLTVMGEEPVAEALPGFAPAEGDAAGTSGSQGVASPWAEGSVQPWSEVPGQPVPQAWTVDREYGEGHW